VPPVATANRISGTPVPGQPVTIRVGASDNTYLERVELTWNDGTWHTQQLAGAINAPNFTQDVQIGPFQWGQQVSFYAKAVDTSGNVDASPTGQFTLCYPDCDQNGVLTVSDFGCFQTAFALAEPYADCNGDGLRTVADFGCFQTKFVSACP
jgi:hypothetical protein